MDHRSKRLQHAQGDPHAIPKLNVAGSNPVARSIPHAFKAGTCVRILFSDLSKAD